jgi:hypothetical protein
VIPEAKLDNLTLRWIKGRFTNNEQESGSKNGLKHLLCQKLNIMKSKDINCSMINIIDINAMYDKGQFKNQEFLQTIREFTTFKNFDIAYNIMSQHHNRIEF